MRLALFLALTTAAAAQPTPDPVHVLRQAREKMLDRDQQIDNYMCVETVNRTYLRSPRKLLARSCDAIMGEKSQGKQNRVIEATDRLRLDVKISEGREIGAWAGARKFDSRSIIDFIGGGPFGTGPLGTLIGNIFQDPSAHFKYEGVETLNNRSVFKYSYRVPLESSHYMIRTAGGWIASAFHGGLWIDSETGDLRRVAASSSELPSETRACVADMDVMYERTSIGARDFLLPGRSEVHFILRNGTESHTLMTYSNCREYHAESTLHFDESTSAETNRGKRAAPTEMALPAGLEVRLVFAEPIDTASAAAGDVFTANVASDVRDEQSRKVVVAAGAKVRGRIIGLQHFFGPSAHFQLTILPQSIEIGGVELPFYARQDWSDTLAEARRIASLTGRPSRFWLPRADLPSNAGVFYFVKAAGNLIARGHNSKWITIAPPPDAAAPAP